MVFFLSISDIQCIVNDEDNFFMLGGTSFSAIKFTYLLWRQTGVDITFPVLVLHPTVSKITEYVLSHIVDTNSRDPESNNTTASAQFSLRKATSGTNIVCLQDKKIPSDPNLFLIHPAFWSSVSYLQLASHFAGICAVYLYYKHIGIEELFD